jgi:hypothetical protein
VQKSFCHAPLASSKQYEIVCKIQAKKAGSCKSKRNHFLPFFFLGPSISPMRSMLPIM